MVNVEQLHSIWLDSIVDFSQNYLATKYGNKNCEAHIVSSVVETNNSYQSLKNFNLPYGSAQIIMHMARFCKCTLCEPDDILGCEMKTFPEATFCLPSLLSAAFPKNVNTGIFRPHDGSLDAGDLDNPSSVFRHPHIAFSGIGIILMNECREILSPLATDSEVIRLADCHFLCLPRGDNA